MDSWLLALRRWLALWDAPAEPRASAMDRDLKRLRARWFAELSQLTDAFLRSPLFLRWMRYGLASMTASMHAAAFLAPWNRGARSRSRADTRANERSSAPGPSPVDAGSPSRGDARVNGRSPVSEPSRADASSPSRGDARANGPGRATLEASPSFSER